MLEEVTTRFTKSVHFHLSELETSSNQLNQLKTMIARFPGSCLVYLHLMSKEETKTVLKLPDDMKVSATPELVNTVNKYFGQSIVKFSADAM